MAPSKRIYAIDVLRGITVAAMIMVNNAGGKLSYGCLQHSEWNGMTFCDMVFPSFLFIVGLSAYISLCKVDFQASRALIAKIIRRTIIILLIGWALHEVEMLLKSDGFGVAHLRLTGVLPRIALCYCAVSLIALIFKKRAIIYITLGLIAVYSVILLAGNGFCNDDTNVLSVVDKAVLGDAHLYTKRPIDPEGLLGTIGAIAHTLIGFMFGSILFDKKLDIEGKLLKMMVWGFALLIVGLTLSLGMPLNKRVWSPSFLLVSCGLLAMMLVAISYVTDIHGKTAMFRPFDVFGVNPLFLYVLSEIVAIVLSATKWKHGIYACINSVIPDPYIASAVYSTLFLLAMWAAGYPLYKKKIYIKI